jgi:Na+/phosphate symporter
MNYNAMSDTEFMHYLDIYNDDPVVRRLINVLARTRGALINDLEDAGMDSQSWTFGDTWTKYSPGQYIEELRNEVRHAENELELAQEELEQAINERDQLKVRSVMQLIEEVNQEKTRCSLIASNAMKEANQVREENDKLREQIDMWGAMNRV